MDLLSQALTKENATIYVSMPDFQERVAGGIHVYPRSFARASIIFRQWDTSGEYVS
jgi:hypothetical protein